MPEVDDGSIGGFNRPELRGLRKQARRGTLTNRERRRLNYLTNEARGRRRSGLLGGLGGAAAALGAAALIKGGGAKGLMDSIKGRMDSLKEVLETRKEERDIAKEQKPSREDRNIEMLEGKPATEIERDQGERPALRGVDENDAAMRQLMEERDLEESDRLTDEEQLQEATREADKISAIDEAKAAGTFKRVGPPRGGSTPEEEFAPGTSTEDMLEALQNVETPEERQRILDAMGAVTGLSGEEEQKQQMILEEALQKGRGTPSGPLQGGVPSGQGEEVEVPMSTRDMLTQLKQGVDPELLGAVRGGGGESLLSKVDPEGLVQGEEGAEGALRLLQTINKRRADFGLPPATKLTRELLDSPTGTIERLNPPQAGPIRSGRMDAGGMVKRMMARYN